LASSVKPSANTEIVEANITTIATIRTFAMTGETARDEAFTSFGFALS